MPLADALPISDDQVSADSSPNLDTSISELQKKLDADSVLLTRLEEDFKMMALEIQRLKERVNRLEDMSEDTITTTTTKDRKISSLQQDDDCPICKDPFQDPHETPCGHVMCKECISQWLMRTKTCPFDRSRVTMLDLVPVTLVGSEQKIQEAEEKVWRLSESEVETIQSSACGEKSSVAGMVEGILRRFGVGVP